MEISGQSGPRDRPALDIRMEKSGLPGQAKELLKRIPTAPDAISSANLVEALGWSQTEIHQIATMLFDAGWIERRSTLGGDSAGGSGIAYAVIPRLTNAP